ncbi:hypothetical protein NDU88_002476, partial [Pleurodeles waltl]
DSAYPNHPWLLMPLRNSTTPEEVYFIEAHGRTWRAVEQAFGLLKASFRCLDKTEGALFYSPWKVCQSTVAYCMLHNIALGRNIPDTPEEGEPAVPPDENPEMRTEDESGKE